MANKQAGVTLVYNHLLFDILQLKISCQAKKRKILQRFVFMARIKDNDSITIKATACDRVITQWIIIQKESREESNITLQK